MIVVVPYESVGPLRFDVSTVPECEAWLGPPKMRRDRQSAIELYYDALIARFDTARRTFVESTVIPPTVVRVGDIVFDWHKPSFYALVAADHNPLNIAGFVVLKDLGVSISGVHDDDESQRAFTVFRRGVFDPLIVQANSLSLDTRFLVPTPPVDI